MQMLFSSWARCQKAINSNAMRVVCVRALRLLYIRLFHYLHELHDIKRFAHNDSCARQTAIAPSNWMPINVEHFKLSKCLPVRCWIRLPTINYADLITKVRKTSFFLVVLKSNSGGKVCAYSRRLKLHSI